VSHLGTLCIFARAPKRGAVKTRLAAGIGADEALDAYRRLVELALSRYAKIPDLRSELWLSGDLAHPEVRRWAVDWSLPVYEQRGSDLGARMAAAIAQGVATGLGTLVVGVDCPAIDVAYVREAARTLLTTDLVLAPAEDGGYGLIGLRRSAPELFRGVVWGSDGVLAETLVRADALGLRHELLETVWDVDDAADWKRFLDSGYG
jgi:rSAM/selenodomain-associated transferase 1